MNKSGGYFKQKLFNTESLYLYNTMTIVVNLKIIRNVKIN